ncbi:hypothetical protein [Erythrobacter alti]|uniref:hypothetical protein n=1 Tax=Erythrobacter alti TaxID=1896145 RepID=UPI0030F389DB
MTENRPDIPLAEQYGAAIDWWRDAGVDCLFEDDIQVMLSEKEPAAIAPSTVQAGGVDEPETAKPKPAFSTKELPGDLDAFRDWWMSAHELPTGSAPRIAPRGEIGSPLMLVAPMPEIDDTERLLAGPQGTMLGNISHALGHGADTPYFASALPAYITLPDWDALGAAGFGSVLRHHIALAKPRRVILFGSKLPALLGQDAAAPPESITEIAGVPALATFAPERLLDHPRQRARLWHRLLEWTA